ncbi:hypothetical protein RCL1_002304 [Eukaryota sp. TZLM3-RCL]
MRQHNKPSPLLLKWNLVSEPIIHSRSRSTCSFHRSTTPVTDRLVSSSLSFYDSVCHRTSLSPTTSIRRTTSPSVPSKRSSSTLSSPCIFPPIQNSPMLSKPRKQSIIYAPEPKDSPFLPVLLPHCSVFPVSATSIVPVKGPEYGSKWYKQPNLWAKKEVVRIPEPTQEELTQKLIDQKRVQISNFESVLLSNSDSL